MPAKAFGDSMQLLVRIAVTVAIVFFCARIAPRLPALSGLIATMPLTGLLVLLWVYADHPGDSQLMSDYTRGAFWGTLPSIAFFLVAFLCFRRQLPLWLVLAFSFAVWLTAAAIHQLLLHK